MIHSSNSTEKPPYRKHVAVLDTKVAYVDVGNGDPIVFLHGVPTPSYLWRNIIPHMIHLGRCLAPDYVGMGYSAAAPNGSYRLRDHQRYLDAWLETAGVKDNVILVVHDWGSALGFNWAQRHADKIKALVYMECIVRPFYSWDDWPHNTPKDVVEVVESYGRWLSTSPIPKLFIDAEPAGFLIKGQREFCRAWPNQQMVTVKGAHFLMEDSPNEVGDAIARFVQKVLAGQIARDERKMKKVASE